MKQSRERKSRIILWLVVLIVLCLAIFALVKLANVSTSNNANGTYVEILPTVGTNEWATDNLNATTTVIEYGDFECPACYAFEPLVQQVHALYGKQIKFIFRQFPLSSIHPNAMPAAEAAEAAGMQGKFWPMHDLIYKTQPQWASLAPDKATALFLTYAQQLNLNINQYKKDAASPEVAQKIQKSYQDGVSLGIQGTPTFFINNTELPQPSSAEDFLQMMHDGITNPESTLNGSLTKNSVTVTTTNGTSTTAQ